tara:strand:+ start:31 stop:216 length:186 start_codon:yes stop_codon:yes gene_type:complete
MENIIDMIAKDSDAAKISDELKDLLYQKAAKKVEDIRPEIGRSMFDDESEVETEPQEEEDA